MRAWRRDAGGLLLERVEALGEAMKTQRPACAEASAGGREERGEEIVRSLLLGQLQRRGGVGDVLVAQALAVAWGPRGLCAALDGALGN